jgi:hypothetical protein
MRGDEAKEEAGELLPPPRVDASVDAPSELSSLIAVPSRKKAIAIGSTAITLGDCYLCGGLLLLILSLAMLAVPPSFTVTTTPPPPSLRASTHPPLDLVGSAEKRGQIILTPDMIDEAETADGGGDIDVPEAGKRCAYVIDTFRAQNENFTDKRALGVKYRAQSTDFNVFYRATAILFWKDFGAGHWGRDQGRSINLDDLVALSDATYDDGITPMSPMSTWTWTTGDQHLSNFGAWRNRGGEVVFSVNDFDEAAIFDFHIDVLRIAVSICNHGSTNGFGEKDLREALEAFTFTYVDTVSLSRFSIS